MSGARMRRRVGGAAQVRATPSPTQQVCQGGAGRDHTLGVQQVRRGEAGQVSFRTNAVREATGNRKASATRPGVALGGARGRGVASGLAMWRGGRGLPLTTWPKPVSHIAPRGGSARCHRSARQATACCKYETCRRGSSCGPSCDTCWLGSSSQAVAQAHTITNLYYAR